jgi:hypothetical protein
VKPARFLPLLWIATTVGLLVAASQDWYAVIKPAPGLARVVATGLESFPLLATLPWVSLLSLLLIWYLGSIGRILVAAITAFLALAGAAQLALQDVNADVLLNKVEKSTGIKETLHHIMSNTEHLWPKYAALALLILLAVTSVTYGLVRLRAPKRNTASKPKPDAIKPNDSRSLWDEQNGNRH